MFSTEEKTVPHNSPHSQIPSSLNCRYSSAPIEQILRQEGLLAAIRFDSPCLPTANPRLYNSGLNSLEGSSQLTEVWTTSAAIEHGSDGQCHWSQTEELIFACLVVDESLFDSQSQAICDAYQRLLKLIARRGYRDIIRAWHYMAEINQGDGDQERYKQFCSGRQRAFELSEYAPEDYPAACALGHHSDQTIIYLLASKQAGSHFENPNQQSAYQYPRQYGPQSPSFARATLVNWAGNQQLHISGTASIIGHQTIHADNFTGQLATTLDNLEQLLSHVAQQAELASTPRFTILKVYLRHSQHLAETKAAINSHYGEDVAVIYLQADICRQSLLVEIDGLCEL